MSGFHLNRVLAAAVVGGSMLASAVVPALSATVSVSPRATPTITEGSTAVVPVEYRKTYRARDARNERSERYDRNRHGPRYSHKRQGYEHYREGYWYRTPFWALAIGAAVSHNSRHASWCNNRYRSYTASRDAFKGYDGQWHRCNSPYN